MIDIIPTAAQAAEIDMAGATAIAIDVLRATTVMATAVANGAECVVPVRTVDEAFALKTRLGNNAVLGGERNADRIEGFDLDNSPLRYTRQAVGGKTVVMTTTNGTQAIANSCTAERLYVASFVNARPTIEAVAKADAKDIFIVCAGTEGRFTIEDALCAGLIASELHARTGNALTDFAFAMAMLYDQNSACIRAAATGGSHYKRLAQKGYSADLDFCFDTSRNLPALVFSDGAVRRV